jgi:tetratricopeptide (TPR) repeat protein
MEAHARLGITLASLGELARALRHLEQAIPAPELNEPRLPESSIGIHARTYASRTLFLLGYPDRARRMCCDAIEVARRGDPADAALALAFAAALHFRLRERDRTRELADEAIALARERGFPFPLALARVYRGWALAGSEGFEEIEQGLEQFVALGAEASRPHGLFAAAYSEAGRSRDALLELEAAMGSRSEASIFDAELYRVKGEVLLQLREPAEAERCFQRALEISRGQQARSLELRAAISLGRFLRKQRRTDEVRELLSPIYDWFTEGFDTADLKDAKVLLEELA